MNLPAVARSGVTIRLVTLFALVAGLLAASGMAAEAITSPKTLYHERPVGVGVVVPGFPIDYVGVAFDLPSGEDARHDHGSDSSHAGTQRIAVRVRHAGVWGPWQRVNEDGAQAPGRWTGALVHAHDADAYQVRGLPTFAREPLAAAINTTDGPEEVVGHRPAGAAEAVTRCMTRAEWGANEALRKGSPVFSPIQVMTVHHTAGGNNDPNPTATVRGIYEWHVNGNGWDDIGYQALISEGGTVYEGRWSGSASPACATGGTGWDFGHQDSTATSSIVTGAHAYPYNTGNFGVALLGNFEGTATPQAGARQALIDYLAELSQRHGLDPQGQVSYSNSATSINTHTISDHGDFANTDCPGDTLDADMPNIRQDVAAALATPTDPTDPSDPTEPTDPAPQPQPVTDHLASSELTSAGTLMGSYLDTHADDGISEVLVEAESGGKPASRTSELQHVWTVPVAAGSSHTLTVDASRLASPDGDDFSFSYSIDGGATYAPAFVVTAGSVGPYVVSLPAATSGNVLVRVRDTNRSAGARSLDRISVDHLVIRSESPTTTEPEPEPAPEPGTDITLTTTGSKVKGEQRVELAWSGATDVRVYRDGRAIGVVRGATTYTDAIAAKGGGTYTHRVCAVDTAGVEGACSNDAVTTF